MMLKGLTKQDVDAKNKQDKADAVRAERNRLLAACDWTQLGDTPFDKQAWAKYRKELRDITNQKTFPESVQWPIAPEVLA
jgi:hypothetical protein